ncbi:phenylalanine--tRNA ligase subunit alpha [Ponticoccus sp. SC2-23]|uniref:phenylalanine--tRNA ligase subunit alpha n=1 Tax=Alexandriicola marinus TaxID=2081710 RepID=UPI000FDAB5C8|nr:phenylalanine--tRNA ligase subunit alpha [Alexandriicola marinus]MBM1222103.1 phenylalanine--tRNA ligase subunit alpha [Ponticoccus sp. SC6-9]MBM1226790.1 phenylalanine--tRNA ligase subunit alpha [Ponticoccus sp. SC6-15]MBM1231050.1 phenylalanine--tRNA ligase subunit alpha [Ponticoccus sp. SC6-38]MBM1235698.1 phenylalanine--tRNA ligase subunit alpha [Ponticoccus sp. SC6-45]MBM1240072.1 phenylalanine--tRNA ligase subunit alpha [Ponticoccus sp. SC6-49]MBM1244426.1 phenylalanine--tRNA ligase 
MDDLRDKYIDLIAGAADEAALEELRVQAVGKKGEISLKMRELGKMTPEERQVAGPALNALKDEINAALAARKTALADAALEERLKGEWLDVTLPARARAQGTIHPISQVTEEITAIFADMGFSVAEGPQIESDWYNFDALNIPGHHPARAEMDTFYTHRADGDNRPPHVLRTHTSPVQIRTMEKTGAPIRIICPGRVYRADYDQTHTPMFHQVEGLAIDRDISMANLKWVLEEFFTAFFGTEVKTRFRASHFPFTEPSAEVDVQCEWVDGQVKVGQGDDWLEVLGSGMVHPNVLRNAGIDPDEWQGFAFGIGIDRLAMLKYGIPDLRAFFDSDLRWLRHYGFSALDVPTLHGGA